MVYCSTATLDLCKLPELPKVVGRTTKLNLFSHHESINPSKKFIGKRISRFTVQSIGASNRLKYRLAGVTKYVVYLALHTNDNSTFANECK